MGNLILTLGGFYLGCKVVAAIGSGLYKLGSGLFSAISSGRLYKLGSRLFYAVGSGLCMLGAGIVLSIGFGLYLLGYGIFSATKYGFSCI